MANVIDKHACRCLETKQTQGVSLESKWQDRYHRPLSRAFCDQLADTTHKPSADCLDLDREHSMGNWLGRSVDKDSPNEAWQYAWSFHSHLVARPNISHENARRFALKLLSGACHGKRINGLNLKTVRTSLILKRENAYRNRDGRQWSAPCSDLRDNGLFGRISYARDMSRASLGKMINLV